MTAWAGKRKTSAPGQVAGRAQDYRYRAAAELVKLDLTPPAGKMMMTMLAAVAEMEPDLLVERTQAGLARVKSEGKTLGRPSKTTAEQRADIIAKYEQGKSVSALARNYDVSRANILGIVGK